MRNLEKEKEKEKCYLDSLLDEGTARNSLARLVDDIHRDQFATIAKMLCYPAFERLVWALGDLLKHEEPKVAGNAAYILGTVAETELGGHRVSRMIRKEPDRAKVVLINLTGMLKCTDSETVMNAAGTIGTLAESEESRLWLLSEQELTKTLIIIIDLLGSSNPWTASNAALVLARLSISDEGVKVLLAHPAARSLLTNLVNALVVDDAGKGMNAAFALGRIIDTADGLSALFRWSLFEQTLTSLTTMITSDEEGCAKNGCFALSSMSKSEQFISHGKFESLMTSLSRLVLKHAGDETGWFAAMCLRSVACTGRGFVRLRCMKEVNSNLRHALKKQPIDEVVKEVKRALDALRDLPKPKPPRVEVRGSSNLDVYWTAVPTESGHQPVYSVLCNQKLIYCGQDLTCDISSLHPNTTYRVSLQATVFTEKSLVSDIVTVTTEESTPSAPPNLRALCITTSQVKIAWDAPYLPNGVLRNYFVYCNDVLIEQTKDFTSIISNLQPSTSHTIQVCASTLKGKGPPTFLTIRTLDLGDRAPSKPNVVIVGRHEVLVQWSPPEEPAGKINRYELYMNGDVVYSGMDLQSSVSRLDADAEYAFEVAAVTQEGKCRSKPTKIKTNRNDPVQREPLYPGPSSRRASLTKDPPTPPKLERAKTTNLPPKALRKRKPKRSMPDFAQLSMPRERTFVGKEKTSPDLKLPPKAPPPPPAPTPPMALRIRSKTTLERSLRLESSKTTTDVKNLLKPKEYSLEFPANEPDPWARSKFVPLHSRTQAPVSASRASWNQYDTVVFTRPPLASPDQYPPMVRSKTTLDINSGLQSMFRRTLTELKL